MYPIPMHIYQVSIHCSYVTTHCLLFFARRSWDTFLYCRCYPWCMFPIVWSWCWGFLWLLDVFVMCGKNLSIWGWVVCIWGAYVCGGLYEVCDWSWAKKKQLILIMAWFVDTCIIVFLVSIHFGKMIRTNWTNLNYLFI